MKKIDAISSNYIFPMHVCANKDNDACYLTHRHITDQMDCEHKQRRWHKGIGPQLTPTYIYMLTYSCNII